MHLTNSPELRFPNFKEKWEPTAIKDLIEKTSKKVELEEGVEYREIGVRSHGRGIFHKDPTDSSAIGNKRVFWVHPKAFVVNIVFAWEQAIALTGESENGMIASHRFPMWLPREDRTNLEFLLYYFSRKRGKYYLELASPGGAGRNKTLGQEEFGKLKIPFPRLDEQNQIASILSSVDRKLSLLIKKHELLVQHKKGVMQKLFARQIRFKDLNGNDFPEWEEKRLGELCQFSKGKGVSKSDLVEDGEIECIRYGELYTHYGEVVGEVKSRTNVRASNLVLSKVGDVLIPASGESAIDIATCTCVTRAGIALGGDLNILRGEFHGPFLAYYLTNAERISLARLAQGSSVTHLYASQFKILKICIPTDIDEQKQIAECLTVIDSKINLVGQQITQMQDFKKGLLQKMFV